MCGTRFRTKPLIEHMRAVPDPRCGRKTKHDHAEVLVCLIMGFMAGRTTMRRSLKWCCGHLKWLRGFMALKNGIASVSTASRILSGIDEELFALEFIEWSGEILNTRGTHLAIDGKALRAAADKVRDSTTPMILNVIDTVTGIVAAQLPIKGKGCEITAIPELLRLLDISGSTVTVDAIGTQTEIMEQILAQGGHFVLTVKRNQPQSYDEIMGYFGGAQRAGWGARKDGEGMHGKDEEAYHPEKNRDRYEHRWYSVCHDSSILTKAQKEWPFIKTVGRIRQVRIPVERDAQGNDITPDVGDFLKNGSMRKPRPTDGDSASSDIQDTGVIADMELSADEIGRIKRDHWAIEGKLHHVLDDAFREDRSPAKKSKNNLALIRKFAYNILRVAILSKSCGRLITEAMDSFCDDLSLAEKYVFNGINSLY